MHQKHSRKQRSVWDVQCDSRSQHPRSRTRSATIKATPRAAAALLYSTCPEAATWGLLLQAVTERIQSISRKTKSKIGSGCPNRSKKRTFETFPITFCQKKNIFFVRNFLCQLVSTRKTNFFTPLSDLFSQFSYELGRSMGPARYGPPKWSF